MRIDWSIRIVIDEINPWHNILSFKSYVLVFVIHYSTSNSLLIFTVSDSTSNSLLILTASYSTSNSLLIFTASDSTSNSLLIFTASINYSTSNSPTQPELLSVEGGNRSLASSPAAGKPPPPFK